MFSAEICFFTCDCQNITLCQDVDFPNVLIQLENHYLHYLFCVECFFSLCFLYIHLEKNNLEHQIGGKKTRWKLGE